MCLGNFLIPPEDIHVISRWVKLDYNWDSKTNSRIWKLPKDNAGNDINLEVVHKDFLTALQVAQKLE